MYFLIKVLHFSSAKIGIKKKCLVAKLGLAFGNTFC